MMGMFMISTVVMVSQVHIYVKTDRTVHFEYMQIILCQPYLNKAAKGKKSISH